MIKKRPIERGEGAEGFGVTQPLYALASSLPRQPGMTHPNSSKHHNLQQSPFHLWTTFFMRPLIFTTLENHHIDGVAECLANSFSEREPLARHLCITKDEILGFTRDLSTKAAKDNMSIVVIDEENSDRIVGCSIAGDLNSDFIPLHEYSSNIQVIFSLIEELSAPFLSQHHTKKIAHVWVTAINEKHSQKYIAQTAHIELAILLRNKGYRYYYCEITNK